MKLSDDELDRYARHIVLREIGGPGQAALKAARVLAVGAGGLGSPAILYLAAAGVGTIGIVDDDTVSLSNLQRQIAHTTASVGRPKTESARDTVRGINPHVSVELHPLRLTAANAREIIGRYDVVADGSDNFPTRFLINDACFFAQKTLVSAAVTEFDGQLSTFKAHEADCPCYRCLFPEPPPPGTVPNCSETGVLGAAAGVMGTLQALEVIKEITGAGESMAGRLLIYEALSTRFRTVTFKKDPACALCGTKPTILTLDQA
ncbi:MAG: molybdopterin-synthase adenylyltransferase MoeB [Alphaproteobacteria bacterium]|nr:molybdopterin-synthase adenylyltransferase MoeB [Alphaproteobacteria bacterium]MBV9419797.1 molybdopterin-synthase adenylyltransferase MoeB [Alphaproteobacteria bacterium]MBV9541494.1 molybdopterin-synthase adenylyltransferase MoeB [Alphaproteobacteria bacterium]MBV9904385.1 molybdopterin-synthase adenylyltransferase MoeB [Alphaproteobacteria bacterium]